MKFKKGWIYTGYDLDYYSRATDKKDYLVGNISPYGLGVVIWPVGEEISWVKSLNDDNSLFDFASDPYNPTDMEISLFELEVGFPYPPKQLLKKLK